MRWKKLLEKTASDEITGELSDDSLDEEFNSDIEYFPEGNEAKLSNHFCNLNGIMLHN
jgi:hypothetical protein